MRRTVPFKMQTPRITPRQTRRSFLAGAGLSSMALGAPFLGARLFDARRAAAQTQAGPKRFFAFFTPNGTVPETFFPETGSLETLSPILAPLESFKDRMLVLKGVHMDSMIGDDKPGGPHMKGPGAMLTGGWLLEGSFTGAGGPAGYANSISVDQELANRIGTITAYPSLEFGVAIAGQEPLRVISYRGPNQPNEPVDDPWRMFERIAPLAVADESERQRLVLQRQSVLDYVKDELASLQAKLPEDDRPRLEAHLSGVRNIERQLERLGEQCALPSLGEAVDPHAKENYPLVGKLQLDLMLAAHTCDLTRVSSFMWSNADSWQYFPWIGIDEEHHALSHLPREDLDARDKLTRINVWYAEQIAYFLAGLRDTPDPDGDGSLLDNSLVLWGNEIGEGGSHTHEDIPWVLVGDAGGFFRSGQAFDLGGQPHNNLLLSILHAYGYADETSFGAPENCTGPLSAIHT